MIRVVLVEDQTLVRQGLRSLLSLAPGIEVVAEASHGDEAIALIPGAGADVVLLDIRMPGEDALGFAAWLRRVRPELVVVLVSAYGVLDVPISLLAAGVGFVAKEDLAPASLLAAIAAARAGHPGDALR